MRIWKLIEPAALLFSLAPVTAFAGSDPTGIWLNDTGRGAIEIKPCGNALCGNVVWVKSSADADGCGKQIIGNVAPIGNGRWDNGWIYSPEKGRKYDVELTPLANGNLKVLGYAGMKFLSKTMIWKPAPADLQLCTGAGKSPATTEAAAEPAPAPDAKQRTAAASPAVVPAPTEATATVPEVKADSDVAAKSPAPLPDQSKTEPDQSAETASEEKGPDLGKLRIGDLQMDKILTKTKNGKCKLDLPWIKVTIDCER